MTTDERFDRIEKSIAEMNREMTLGFDKTDRYLLDFRSEVIGRFEKIEGRLATFALRADMEASWRRQERRDEELDKRWHETQDMIRDMGRETDKRIRELVAAIGQLSKAS